MQSSHFAGFILSFGSASKNNQSIFFLKEKNIKPLLAIKSISLVCEQLVVSKVSSLLSHI